jgi:hypothetical protein
MQDQAASAPDGGDWDVIERFEEAFWSLPDEERAAFVGHVLLGEQVEIIAELLGRTPRWVMDSIRESTARLASCHAPDGRFGLSSAELRELLERLPVPDPPAAFHKRVIALWGSHPRTVKWHHRTASSSGIWSSAMRAEVSHVPPLPPPFLVCYSPYAFSCNRPIILRISSLALFPLSCSMKL